MMDLVELRTTLEAFQLTRKRIDQTSSNLKDLTEHFNTWPVLRNELETVVSWFRDNPDWAKEAAAILACLKTMQEALNEIGYDRWTLHPEDGGVPY